MKRPPALPPSSASPSVGLRWGHASATQTRWSAPPPLGWGGARPLLGSGGARSMGSSSVDRPGVGWGGARALLSTLRTALRLRWTRAMGFVALVALSLLTHRILLSSLGWNAASSQQRCLSVVAVGGDQGWGLPFNHFWEHPRLHPGDCLSFNTNSTNPSTSTSTSTSASAQHPGDGQGAGPGPGPSPSVWQLSDICSFQSCNFTGAVLVGTGPRVLFQVPTKSSTQDVLYFASAGGDGHSHCLEGLRVEVFLSTASPADCSTQSLLAQDGSTPLPLPGTARDLPAVLWQSDFELPPGAANGDRERAVNESSKGESSSGGSCQSRTGWACLQGPRAPSLTPSEHLLQYMNQYRRHWHWCRLRESTGEAAAKLARGEPTVCKYILWAQSPEGLGNNLLSLGSAFVHALVTASILLVDSASVVADLLCEPFPGELSWLVDHERLEEIGKVFPFEEAKRSNKQFSFDTTRPAPNVLPWYIWIPDEIDSSRFFCPSFNDWADGASALLSVSNMYWVPGLYLVPKYRQLLDLLFPSRAVFPVLRPLIFHPKDHVWESVLVSMGQLYTPQPGAPLSGDSRQGGRPASGESSHAGRPRHSGNAGIVRPNTRRVQIAVQHRDFVFWTPVEKAVDEAASCVSRIVSSCRNQSGGQYGGARNASIGCSSDDDSWQLGSTKEGEDRSVHPYGQEEVDPGKLGLLVASLATGFKKGIKERLSDLLKVHETQKPNDTTHNSAALRDILLLSLTSSFILVTPFSTFGYIAVAFSNARPLIISESCEETKVEPCYLLPPKMVRCHDTGKSFKIEFGMLDNVNDTMFERCPDIRYLEQYRAARGDTYECCNYGFSLAISDRQKN